MKVVLLVDPSVVVAHAVKTYLEKDKNMQVIIANSAQAGIHAADDKRPDLVILELAIPRHNGYAFLHEFRSHSDWSSIPVIVHSHLSREEAAMSTDWKFLGAKEYLYKPTTTLKKLQKSVQKVIQS